MTDIFLALDRHFANVPLSWTMLGPVSRDSSGWNWTDRGRLVGYAERWPTKYSKEWRIVIYYSASRLDNYHTVVSNETKAKEWIFEMQKFSWTSSTS